MIRSRLARRIVLASAAGLLLAGLGAAPAVAAPAAPAPPRVTITALGHNGTGCPPGTVGSAVTEDGSGFTVVFDRFEAEARPGGTPDEARRNCRLDIDLTAPAGWSWAVGRLTTQGYVDLPADTTAESVLTAYAGGRSFTGQRQTFTGPVSRVYETGTTSPVTNLNWSACGGTGRVSLDQQIRLSTTSPGARALAKVDATDGNITSGPGRRSDATIVWTRCSN